MEYSPVKYIWRWNIIECKDAVCSGPKEEWDGRKKGVKFYGWLQKVHADNVTRALQFLCAWFVGYLCFFAFFGGRRNESDKLIDTQNIQQSLEFIWVIKIIQLFSRR